MGSSWKVALALGFGYFLGRTHKTRLALLLAAGAATGGFGGAAGRVLKSGSKRLATSESLGKLSPDFAQVVDSLKGDLADAGKAAAKAAISSRLDAVADSIHDRTETLRGQGVVPDDEPVSADSASLEDDERAGREPEDSRSERTEHRRPPERDRSSDRERPSDRDRPRHPPRPRPSGESPRVGRPASSRRGRGD